MSTDVELSLKQGDNDPEAPPAPPRVLLGPVVGLVTASEARILFELESDCLAEICATPSIGPAVSAQHQFCSRLPGCFVLTGLQAGTRYTFDLVGTSREGSFATLDPTGANYNIVVASCDKAEKGRGKDIDMFKVLHESIQRGEIDLVVRNGDQVYADKAFAKAKKVLMAHKIKETRVGCVGLMAEDNKRVLKEVLGFYQETYRHTWNQEWVAKCYANCAHIMLLDDHEIRNDWGTFKNDDNASHYEYHTGYVGRLAYYLYQRQLWDPLVNEQTAFTYTPTSEGEVFRFNKIGLILVDCRGSRSWCKVENEEAKKAKKTWLSGVQWTRIAESLNPGGELSECSSLVVVHSTPPIYLCTRGSRCLASCCSCQVDKMGFGLFPEEQADYFDLLLEWRNTRLHRSVVLLGGDLHHHMSTYLYKNNRRNSVTNNRDRRSSLARGFGFRQVVCSAINNKPPKCFVNWLIRCLMCRCCGPIKVARDWEAKHMDFLYERNYLIVKVCPFNTAVLCIFHLGLASPWNISTFVQRGFALSTSPSFTA